ncbi:MAG: ATP-binding protein [Cyclobacteriaceae bacterium]|nr:ATP-binding protein [Cyclobacteriaceae bacterium]
MFTLANTGELEVNDVRHPEIYPIEGYRYKICITPRSRYWRFGIRYGMNVHGSGYSSSHRYSNAQVRSLEICVGKRNPKWNSPNHLQLQEHYITPENGTYYSSEHYIENDEVQLILTPQGENFIIAELSSGDIYHKQLFEVGFSRIFEIFGWADKLDFHLDFEIMATLEPISLPLKPFKAYTHEKTALRLDSLNVFFGTNNSGKSSILVSSCDSFMDKLNDGVDYLGLNRVYTTSAYDIKLEAFDVHERSDKQKENRRKRVNLKSNQYGLFDWMEELALQDEATREKILAWMNIYFDTWSFEDQKTGRYVTNTKAKVNDLDPMSQGSGARSVLPIIIQLYNPLVTFLAIDEPELGLEPRIQKIVFAAMQDASKGENGFPLKRILIATHSHLFLDRVVVANNHYVQKKAGVVEVQPVQDLTALQRHVYQLLGASPSDLFFPANIVVVEGRSDEIFLRAVVKAGRSVNLFRHELSFHFVDGYDNAKVGAEAIVQMLKTQVYSPVYRERICGLFDKPFKRTKLLAEIRELFGDADHKRFIVLDKPAIEYYYPLDIANSIFEVAVDAEGYQSAISSYLQAMSKTFPFTGTIFDKSMGKIEFAKAVAQRMESKHLEQTDTQIIALLKTADGLAYS